LGWRQLLSWDKNESPIAWSWQMHGPHRDRYMAAMADPANGHLRFIRLTSPAAARRFLRTAGSASGGDQL
jgi:hypothetical protein